MTETWIVQVPCWSLVALTLPVPLAWLWSLWRGRRYPAGHCHKCGYDLRESPGRCPECGSSPG